MYVINIINICNNTTQPFFYFYLLPIIIFILIPIYNKAQNVEFAYIVKFNCWNKYSYGKNTPFEHG